MRRILAAFALSAGGLTAIGVNIDVQAAAAAHCPAGSIEVPIVWGAGGFVVPEEIQDTGYTLTYPLGTTGETMTFTVDDPFNRNEDANNPLLNLPTADGNWDPPFPTQTDGSFGPGALTWSMNSLNSDEVVTFAYSFTTPVYVPDLSVGDIDFVGIDFDVFPNDAFADGAYNANPHDSFQDEVLLTADRLGTLVGFNGVTGTAGRPVVTLDDAANGQFAVAGGPYDIGPGLEGFGNVLPDDPIGIVNLETISPVTAVTMGYSNGPDDEVAEANKLAAIGGTWPAENIAAPMVGNETGVSNNHTIVVNGFTVCVGDLLIGDTVFLDYDGDGVQDSGDTGMAGVTVTLYDDLGQVVETTTTDANGNYSFVDVLPWDGWNVEITPPSGYTNTGDLDGGDDGTTVVDTSAGNDRLDADFALQPPPSSVSGSVYADHNNDGAYVPGDGDTPIEAVTITLEGTDLSGNTVFLTVTTDANGDYSFVNLVPGTYTITESQPTGFDDGIDRAGTLATNTANDEHTVILGPGDSSINNDFYEIPNSSIAGTVFVDPNNNGEIDAGDTGIEGVTITLSGSDEAGNTVNLTTTTAADGTYSFENLRPGVYTVTETQPAGYIDGVHDAGSSGGNDTLINDQISAISLAVGTDAVAYDFGELQGASITGSVYDDAAGGGNPIEGVEITLSGVDDLGNPVSITVFTDANGDYAFTGLRPSDSYGYTVTETQPDGYGDGGETVGSLGGTATDDQISGIVLLPRTSSVDNDFYETTGSISGTVFSDLDNDGVQGPDEPGIPGVAVTLTGTDDVGNTIDVTVQTDADGNYSFEILLSGDYTITETQPDQYRDGIDTAGTSGGDAITVNDEISGVVLDPGGESSSNNFAELANPASICGVIWKDLNNDGIEDPTEPPAPGVTVNLYDADGNLVGSTTTDSNGDYCFVDLSEGEYTVELVTPGDTIVTLPNEGTDDTVDSDFPYINTVVVVTLTSGEDVTNIDGGIIDENKDLAVEITTATTTANVGDTVVYTVEGTNSGNTPVVGGTEIVVNVPAGLSITGTNSDHLCVSGGLVVEGAGVALTHGGCWQIVVDGQIVTAVWTGDVQPGETPPVFTIDTEVKSPGDFVVAATISALDGSAETTYVNNADNVVITVPGAATPPVLAITGTDTGRAVGRGLLLTAIGAAAVAVEWHQRRRLRHTD